MNHLFTNNRTENAPLICDYCGKTGLQAEEPCNRDLESAVIEAAIKWRESEKRFGDGQGLWEWTHDLRTAVDALMKARSETKGNSQDDLISEDREHVPCEETK